jgi:putative endonuclease
MRELAKYFVYILLCADNTLYTGITPDIEKRMLVHASGKGSKYVRTRLPFRLIYQEEVANKIIAAQREYEIKQWPREQKIKQLRLVIDL